VLQADQLAIGVDASLNLLVGERPGEIHRHVVFAGIDQLDRLASRLCDQRGLGDEVVLRTWVGKATRLTFERFTEIRRNRDGRLLSKARTLWCPINAQTSRPMRVSAEVRAQFST
jgi:hypothetical protein